MSDKLSSVAGKTPCAQVPHAGVEPGDLEQVLHQSPQYLRAVADEFAGTSRG